MDIRKRIAIETVPGLSMKVRTTAGLGAVSDQFRPCSLDEKGAMILMKNRIDLDTPLRVNISASQEIAQEYASKFGESPEALKGNEDGSFQLFEIWLKIQWTKIPNAKNIKLMGYNKLLWDLHPKVEDGSIDFVKQAQKLMNEESTTNIETIQILRQIIAGEALDFPLSQTGIHDLSRNDGCDQTKMLYCLLGGYSYQEIVQAIGEFEVRYMLDPFQQQYGVLHGTIALNQGNEKWENAYLGLKEIMGY